MIVAIADSGPGVHSVIEFRSAPDPSAAVASFCADHSPPLDPAAYVGADADGRPLLSAWAYDAGAGALVEDLASAQAQIIAQIKAHRDGQRLAHDLTAEYPAGSGLLFGCSAASQDNWAKLATLDDQGAIAYPFDVTTADERSAYSLIDTADRQAATLAVSAVVLTERATAAGCVSAVLAAGTIAEAQAAAAPYLAL